MGLAMKIESSTKPFSAPVVKDARGPSVKNSAVTSGDEVQLSGLSSQLRTSDDEAVFNSVKVAEIKEAIAEGRFTINASAIADRLIASAKELVDSRHQA